MSMQPTWGFSAPDDPLRRLFWIVPLSLLLVILFILGVGRWLKYHAPVKPPQPVDARIFELPPTHSRVVMPHTGKPAATVHPQPHVTRAPATNPQHRQANQGRQNPSSHAPHEAAPPGEAMGVPVPQAPVLPKIQPTPPARTAVPSSPLNWSKLNQQINDAVMSTVTRAELPQIHDPHSLVARYYLATVLRKLQRIGDMNYPGSLVGNTRIMLVIGRDGELIGYKLLDSSGNAVLDQVSGNIAHMSSPFAPFPDEMSKQTSSVKLIIDMNFEGYRDLNPD